MTIYEFIKVDLLNVKSFFPLQEASFNLNRVFVLTNFLAHFYCDYAQIHCFNLT